MLIHNFITYSERQPDEHKSIWMWLVIAQHHGLPTRLLDWTYSPFVAAYFATTTAAEYDDDGIIWCVDVHDCFEHVPARIRNIVRKNKDLNISVLNIDLMDKLGGKLAEFDKLHEKAPFVLFFEPPSLDQRIVSQRSILSVMPDPRTDMNKCLGEQLKNCRRIIIPSHLKLEIRDRLDHANINERILFPGLDGLSSWLSHKYNPIQELL